MSQPNTKLINSLLCNASARIISDPVIGPAIIKGDYEMMLARLHELVGLMDDSIEFGRMKDNIRFKSMDAAAVLGDVRQL